MQSLLRSSRHLRLRSGVIRALATTDRVCVSAVSTHSIAMSAALPSCASAVSSAVNTVVLGGSVSRRGIFGQVCLLDCACAHFY